MQLASARLPAESAAVDVPGSDSSPKPQMHLDPASGALRELNASDAANRASSRPLVG